MSANGRHGRDGVQRLPLLTGIEAPSVTVAEESFDPEDYLESARPRSGMRSAFMNMANSIIGAGIIGQPYAIRNAGLVTGTALLIGLTIVVDWTIRLIVINSKLSGTDSFQATVQHCFGRSGLVAISLAQWLLYVTGFPSFGSGSDGKQCVWRHGGILRYRRRHNTESHDRLFSVPVRHALPMAPG